MKFWNFSRRYVLRYIWWYILGALCLAGTQACSVAIIEATRQAVDTVNLTTATANTVTPFVWRIALFAIGLIGIRTLSRVLMFTPARKIEFTIRNDYFSRLLLLQRDFFSRHEAGDLVSRCSNDIAYVRNAYGFGVLQVANAAFTLSFAVIAMLHMDVRGTLYLALPMIISLAITQLSIAFMFRHWELANRQLGELSSLTLASYKGVSVIQAYHAEPDFERRFLELERRYLNTFLTTTKLRSFVFPIIQMVGNISVFLILWVIGHEVISGRLTLGEITAFLGYVAMVMPPMLSLGWILNVFHQAIPAIVRLDEILLATPKLLEVREKIGGPVGGQTVLTAQGLSYCYPLAKDKGGNPFALRDIHFILSPGKVMGVVGEIGSGKTTLTETILRLNFLEPGQLFINGKDAALCDIDEYRRHFSFAPQKAFLFCASVRDNLKLAIPAEQWEKDLDDLFLAYLNLSGFVPDPNQFPQGLDTVVGEKGVMLSGGQRQRIALARALLKQADIYILDDVLSSVDYETEQVILENLGKCAPGKSFIIISHRVSAVCWADEIIVLREGRIADRGKHEDLIARPGYYRDIFEYQAQKETPQTG